MDPKQQWHLDWLILHFKHNYIYIRYMYYWYLQFFNNVIINKTKVHLPWTYVVLTDYGNHCLDPLVYTSHGHMWS